MWGTGMQGLGVCHSLGHRQGAWASRRESRGLNPHGSRHTREESRGFVAWSMWAGPWRTVWDAGCSFYRGAAQREQGERQPWPAPRAGASADGALVPAGGLEGWGLSKQPWGTGHSQELQRLLGHLGAALGVFRSQDSAVSTPWPLAAWLEQNPPAPAVAVLACPCIAAPWGGDVVVPYETVPSWRPRGLGATTGGCYRSRL